MEPRASLTLLKAFMQCRTTTPARIKTSRASQPVFMHVCLLRRPSNQPYHPSTRSTCKHARMTEQAWSCTYQSFILPGSTRLLPQSLARVGASYGIWAPPYSFQPNTLAPVLMPSTPASSPSSSRHLMLLLLLPLGPQGRLPWPPPVAAASPAGPPHPPAPAPHSLVAGPAYIWSPLRLRLHCCIPLIAAS